MSGACPVVQGEPFYSIEIPWCQVASTWASSAIRRGTRRDWDFFFHAGWPRGRVLGASWRGDNSAGRAIRLVNSGGSYARPGDSPRCILRESPTTCAPPSKHDESCSKVSQTMNIPTQFSKASYPATILLADNYTGGGLLVVYMWERGKPIKDAVLDL